MMLISAAVVQLAERLRSYEFTYNCLLTTYPLRVYTDKEKIKEIFRAGCKSPLAV